MPSQWTCSNGHSWESSPSDSGAGTATVQCPTCGEAMREPPPIATDDLDRTRAYASGAEADGGSDGRGGWPAVAGYEILGLLGSGGMGVVYKARQIGLKRVVALKMILTGSHARGADVARFRAEAEAVARLQHPGIVQVYEIGEWRSEAGGAAMPFFSLEFVDGGSLSSYLDGKPQPPRFAAELMIPLTDAIQYAHDHNVVHRDLKPSNILLHGSAVKEVELESSKSSRSASSTLLTSGGGLPVVKITDFGLAKQLDDVSAQTISGAILGTPSYMAPEQAMGHAATAGPAVDVYSLGAILYEMLTGGPPFRSARVLDTLEQVRYQDPVAPCRLQPRTPRDLETICLKCLRKEPEKRYASARELGDDVRRFLKGEPILARHITRAERFRLWCKRNPLVAGLTFLIALTLLVGTVASTLFAVKFYGQREVAEQNAAKEKAARQRAERERYAALFATAAGKWNEAHINEAVQVLDRLTPTDEEQDDLRGFEWHYLKRKCELELQTLKGHDGTVFAVAYSPDGRFLASAGRDKTVRIWNRATGKVVHVLRGHPDEVFSLAYSADGKRLASGGMDGTLKVWNALTGVEDMALAGQKSSVRGVTFSPDGRTLYSGGADGTLRRWDLFTRSGTILLKHKESIRAMAHCPTRRVIVAGSSDGALMIHDLTRIVKTVPAHAGYILAITVSPDGARLASAAADRSIKIWDTVSWKLQATLNGHTNYVNGVAFNADGTRLVSGGEDRVVRVWDVKSGRELLELRGHVGNVNGVGFSPDGRHVASAGFGGVKIWDARESFERTVLAGHTSTVTGVAFSPNGRLIASCSVDRTVILWDAVTGLKLRTLSEHRAELTSVAFHPTRPLLVSGGADGGVQFWNTDTWRPIKSMKEHRDQVRCVAFSPDGRWLATASQDTTIGLWDVERRRLVRRLRGHSKVVSGVAFSADGGELASIGLDKTVRLWNVESGRSLLVLTEHEEGDPHTAIAFDPTGRRVAAGSLTLWDLSAARKAFSTEITVNPYAIAFSPDGRRIASTGADRIVRLHDAVSGAELLTLTASTSRTGHCLAFSPDGSRLACGAADSLVYLWDARPLDRESRTERDAVSLIRALAGQAKSPSELQNLIGADRSTTDAVRRRALRLSVP